MFTYGGTFLPSTLIALSLNQVTVFRSKIQTQNKYLILRVITLKIDLNEEFGTKLLYRVIEMTVLNIGASWL